MPDRRWADDGQSCPAMDVVVACLSSEKGGGLEEGGRGAAPGGREADDGKRSPAMDVVESCLSSEKGGGLEEGGLKIAPERREPDDGKRFPAVDVVSGLFLGENLLKMGGGPGGGGKKSDRGERIRICSCVVLNREILR